MGATLTGNFETRRAAEMAVERLVQEYGLERTDIFITSTGSDNTAGQKKAGSDTKSDARDLEGGGAPALKGSIEVSVDIQDDSLAQQVRNAFSEFNATTVAGS